MKAKIFCHVCKVSFSPKDTSNLNQGQAIICPVCGETLKITRIAGHNKDDIDIDVEKYFDDPKEEIRDRIENFARLRNYTFNEDKEEIIQGLLEKNNLYGDFYCPCRLDNIDENICPCLETRQNQVKKDGYCL